MVGSILPCRKFSLPAVRLSATLKPVARPAIPGARLFLFDLFFLDCAA